MSLLTQDEVTEVFCAANEFCKGYAQLVNENKALPCNTDIKRRNRNHQMSDSEIMTILILYHFSSFKNFKHFYLMYIDATLRREYPKQLETVLNLYTRKNESNGKKITRERLKRNEKINL
ncbi:hypothetical protein D0T49_00725 [Paludibacter sp. 221]|uniref:hypothetical protein n=1 Tax=Paludibacter sp. 221 TaxID=2302939 RepID=UPI0013D55AAC|nr:hypothetical protein [Paludibacter sp. 221]NDV45577.1 hypothetical protein [Paludibacter sp. 221]